MKTQKLRQGCTVLASLTLMTIALAAASVAQAPNDPGGLPPNQNGRPAGPPPGGFGGPDRGGNNGRSGSDRAGFPGRPPFASGTVSAVDVNAGTITITSQLGGNSSSQVITVGSAAQLITQFEVAVADLKVGDQVQIQGIPTGITVSQLTAGQPPFGLPGAGGFGPGGLGGPRGGGNGGARLSPASSTIRAAAPSFATANGTILALPTKADPPLALSLNAEIQISLKIADGAKITRYKTLKIADIKNGDQIMATGQNAADGTPAISTVGVNLVLRDGFGGPPQ